MQRYAIPLVLSCVALVACGDDTTVSLKPQALTRVEQSNDLDECENGGVKISSGVDDNKDGKLDDEEVTEEQVICAGDSVDVDGEPGELTRVDVLKVGDEDCPIGGVAVHRGIDDDRDEKLDDDEIKESEFLCSPEGESPHGVLVRTTELAVGDASCPWGGKLVESGIDDGAGAGEPDDEVLADDEVDTSYVACNAQPPRVSEPTEPPAGPVGTTTIDLRGGVSAAAQGGYGGSIYGGIDGNSTCVPEITKFFATGAADASFVIPTIEIGLGAEPYEVTADTTLALLPGDLPSRTDGARYLDTNSSAIVRWEPNGAGAVQVTGLRVAAGATLTLPATAVALDFAQDVDIAGKIALSDGASRSFYLYARTVQFAATSAVDLTGSSGSPSTISINARGSIVALGQLSAAGSDTSTLAGGSIQLYSGGRMYVGGSLDASGGDSMAASAAAGGSIYLQGGIGGVWSSAALNAAGGTGALLGGNGGSVNVGVNSPGNNTPREIRNTGAIDASGGSQTLMGCSGGPCTAGIGGGISVYAQGANLRNTGSLKANGGSSHSVAGPGGSIIVGIQNLNSGSQVRSRMSISGDVHAQGGAGLGTAGAGAGGYVNHYNCGGSTSVTEWLGYSSIVISGGSGMTAGGGGGEFGLSDSYSSANTDFARRLYHHVPILAKGGDGGSAGEGGELYVSLSVNTQLSEELPAELPSAIFAGDHVFSGGTGVGSSGGGGGYFALEGRGGVILLGSLAISGGNSDGDAGYGGYAIVTSYNGKLQNSAALTANGGASTAADGGYGGCIDLQGNALSNDAAVSAHGGAGMTQGGDGGTVSLSNVGSEGTNSGVLDVAGGAGMPAGASGLAGFGVGQCGKS